MVNQDTLAIIGTAGRGEDGPKLASNAEGYVDRMLAAARKVADLTKANHLVSGGAAWADHIAVLLFLSDPTRFTLQIEAPAEFVTSPSGGLEYVDTGERGKKAFIANPGGTCNYYHHSFADALGATRQHWSPFLDFALVAGHPRATIRVTHGFDPRNALVAESKHALAMTFGQGATVKDGGTARTMKAFLSRADHGSAYHLDLSAMKLIPNARVAGMEETAQLPLPSTA